MSWFQCSRGRSLSHTDESPRRYRRRDAPGTAAKNVFAENTPAPFSPGSGNSLRSLRTFDTRGLLFATRALRRAKPRRTVFRARYLENAPFRSLVLLGRFLSRRLTRGLRATRVKVHSARDGCEPRCFHLWIIFSTIVLFSVSLLLCQKFSHLQDF